MTKAGETHRVVMTKAGQPFWVVGDQKLVPHIGWGMAKYGQPIWDGWPRLVDLVGGRGMTKASQTIWVGDQSW